MTHKSQEACQLFIEQEIEEGLKQGKTPYSIGKELAIWVEKLFEVCISPKTIISRADKKKKDYIKNNIIPPITIENDLEFQDRKPGKGKPNQPRKYPQPKPKSTFNRTNDETIEWAAWTWNPVTGCEHGCTYCYARDIARRFYDPKIGFTPHFYPERLSAPINTPTPTSTNPADRSVFVVSMGDLFGDWVPQQWIDEVLNAICKTPQWNYIFLTKNPRRYIDITWPVNCWVGATADTQVRADRALEVFYQIKQQEHQPTALFLSMEPLLEKIVLPETVPCDWLIIGGRSQTSGGPAMQPKWEWVASIDQQFPPHGPVKVYFKPKCRRREWPSINIS